MSTHKIPLFREKLSPFLLGKMETASRAAEVLASQYRYDPREEIINASSASRHYEADIVGLRGAERIYRRTVVIEPTRVCAAHCRWCIRANYGPASLKDEEIEEIARYCGAPAQRDDLREVIVTGGDPLMVPRKLELLLEKLEQHAPNIETYRIGTRLPLQNPALVDGSMLRIFERFADRIEIAIHVNHHLELFPEVVAAIRRLRVAVTTMYNHTVLLRGVNDTVEEQVALAERLRELRIETHYLFHCVPMKGMQHHRTSVARGIALASRLANSGLLTGRAKPMFTLMTALGKVTMYEGTIVRREGSRLLVQTDYRHDERLRWNPSWRLPSSAIVNADGRMLVWYEDNPDDDG